MKLLKIPSLIMAGMMIISCQSATKKQDATKAYEKGTFGYDLNFLNENDSIVVLKNHDGSAQLALSPKYQAKVFTSTAEGLDGKSFGWVNYKAFGKPLDPHMNAYGGEDRLWLGPEGGKFSLYFKPGDSMVFKNWKTPAGIDSESWTLVKSDGKRASLNKDMELQNYAGTNLKIKLERDVEILEKDSIEKALNITLDTKVNSVAFKTLNTIINTGTNEWTEKTGAPCIWSLDMFSPSPKTVIVIPYIENAPGKVATTDYFGEIAKDRITYKNGILLFKADGKSRGKLGIPPLRVKNVAGSYAADQNLLTITMFDVNNKAKYLNQEWTPDKDPFSGDGMNAYNDGPLADGSQMGPFYELESVSPPTFLKPGEKHTHMHSVFHFTGDKTALNEIAKKVLGISLDEIADTFKD
ncbi:DUF6786 family protein [Pedobacter foliorum]|uniref:DUF6786 family protein n=1 Tax=Pedobacter foliorum TaxID=2739058 RepID=UPI001564B8D2|nr:DUF6786 family protein [Pedobacter foliorum]NRF37332.1 hypothetical protein [Pedobacter foliorum]